MKIGNGEAILGDCLEEMDKLIERGVKVDAIITDPPYKIISGGCRKSKKGNETTGVLNRGDSNKRTDCVDEVRNGKMFKHNKIRFNEWLPKCWELLKEGTHCYIMVNDKNMQEMLNEATKVGFKISNILIWKKNNATPNKYYMKNTEFTLMFRKGKARNINNMGSKQCVSINNIIGKKKHPTEKPIELMEFYIGNSTNMGDIVLDPFMGSGTTAVACKNLNRKFIGIEIDDKYFNIGLERLGKTNT